MGNIFDIHCHILPGVDDGSRDIEESLKLLASEAEQGVDGVVLTPHYRHEMFETSEERILEAFEELKSAAKESVPGMQLRLGCETHVSMDLEEDLQLRRFLKMADTNILLMEFSGMHTRNFISERIRAVQRLGITPILAHAERFLVFRKNPEFLEDLKRQGVMVQINADALLGYEGFGTRSFCRKLLNYDLVDFIASDAHDIRERPSNIGNAAYQVARKFGEETAYRIFYENPGIFFS